MKKFGQSGFATIEAVLILVILAMVAGTGYFVWHAKQNTNASLNQAAKLNTQTPRVTKKPDTVAQKIKDSNTASVFVEKTYATYATALNKNHNVSTAINVIKDDLSDDLFVSLLGKSSNSDPVLCTQDMVNPASIRVSSVIPSATVIGTDITTLQGDTPATIQANYDIRTQKIVSISCLSVQN